MTHGRSQSYLPQLPDLFPQTPHGRVADVARVLNRHAENERVNLAGQLPHDRQRCHVQGDSRALLQFAFVDL